MERTERIYAAEDAALDDVGPRLRTWVEVEQFVQSVLNDDWWISHPAHPPIDVALQRRSRSARYAAADFASATIFIPDGQWSPHVVLHELAHLLAPTHPDPHAKPFVDALLELVRRYLGFDAYGSLRAELAAGGCLGEE